MRKFLSIAAGLSFLAASNSFVTANATTYGSDGTVQNIQSIHDNLAHDGDTITVPVGTFSWTARLNVARAQSRYRVKAAISAAGTVDPTINDGTIIQDNTPRSGTMGMLFASIAPDKSFRFTGMTFVPGATRTFASNYGGAFHFGYQGSTPSMNNRIDHCHFNQLYQGKLIWVSGWVYGVADHNVFDLLGNTFPGNINEEKYGNKAHGDGAWNDYPWYGTDKFFFFEDNSFFRPGGPYVVWDSGIAGRVVCRHNYIQNCMTGPHGTESRERGSRAFELYDNHFHATAGVASVGAGGTRGGTCLVHDNIFDGTEPGLDKLGDSNYYRAFRYGYTGIQRSSSRGQYLG